MSIKNKAEVAKFREWLEGKINAHEINSETEYNRAFCHACNTTHARQWFTHQDRRVDFYFCWVNEPLVVESKKKATFVTFQLSKYMDKYPLGSISYMARLLGAVRRGFGFAAEHTTVHVGIDTTPPFISVGARMEFRVADVFAGNGH